MSNFSVQQPNLDLVNWLSAYFTRRNEPNFSLAKTIGTYLALPGLVGFWPGSITDATGRLIDISGNGLHMTNNNVAVLGSSGLAAYFDYNGSNQYHAIADAAIFDILGTETHINTKGLTIGAWVYHDGGLGNGQTYSAKWTASNQSYLLDKTTGDLARFAVGSTGANAFTVSYSTESLSVDTWYFVCGRFTPSTEIKVWVNSNNNTNLTSIPAAIYNGISSFGIGAQTGGVNYMNGRICLSFLSAAAVSDAIILNLFQQTRGLFNV